MIDRTFCVVVAEAEGRWVIARDWWSNTAGWLRQSTDV